MVNLLLFYTINFHTSVYKYFQGSCSSMVNRSCQTNGKCTEYNEFVAPFLAFRLINATLFTCMASTNNNYASTINSYYLRSTYKLGYTIYIISFKFCRSIVKDFIMDNIFHQISFITVIIIYSTFYY